jgi:hypothetical protein
MSSNDIIREWMDFADLPEELYDPDRRMCGFDFVGRFDVVVEAPKTSEDVFISIDIIGAAEVADLPALMMNCMKLNAYGLETRGASLGYDENARMVILSYRVNGRTLTAAGLSAIVNNLVEVAQTLQDRIRALLAPAAGRSAAGDAVVFTS